MSFRAGFVGVIGLPNSGKSTLVNKLVGEKVSIVSSKPQTTRRRSLGILTRPEGQIVFVDAPGVLAAKSGLNHFLMEEAQDVIAKADALMVVLNIDEQDLENLKKIINLAVESNKPWFAVIHKTDLPQLHRPEILKKELGERGVEIIKGSALHPSSEFLEQVTNKALSLLPESPQPIYDRELFTAATIRDLCAEIIREKCFELLHQEIPFSTAVRILRFQENDGPVLKIEAEIIVSKPNHQGIVVGREARVIKEIGMLARKDIEELVQQKVFLRLEVATAKDWFKNPRMMKEFGYVLEQ
jgi:GTP-binding protein Era